MENQNLPRDRDSLLATIKRITNALYYKFKSKKHQAKIKEIQSVLEQLAQQMSVDQECCENLKKLEKYLEEQESNIKNLTLKEWVMILIHMVFILA